MWFNFVSLLFFISFPLASPFPHSSLSLCPPPLSLSPFLFVSNRHVLRPLYPSSLSPSLPFSPFLHQSISAALSVVSIRKLGWKSKVFGSIYLCCWLYAGIALNTFISHMCKHFPTLITIENLNCQSRCGT